MIDREHQNLSIRQRSKLLGVNRFSIYVKHQESSDVNHVANMIAEIYTDYPIYGYRRITALLRRQGIVVNHKRVSRLMLLMNLRAIYLGPNTSKWTIVSLKYAKVLFGVVVYKIIYYFSKRVSKIHYCYGHVSYTGVSDRWTIDLNDRRHLGTLALSLETFE